MAAPGANVNSASTLVSLLQQAGFKGAGLQTMFKIIMAESGGRSNAYNGNASTGDKSYGLAQINMIGNIGTSRLKQYGLTSYDQLFDPLTNLKAAYRISKGGTNFNAWTTYTSGKYQSHAYDPNYVVNTAGHPATGSTGSLSPSLAAPSASGKTVTPADFAAQVGWSTAVLNSNPELKALFASAMASGPDGWSSERFQAAVEGTNWWKKQSDATRQWKILSLTDPATAAARKAERVMLITQTAEGLGVKLSPAALSKIVNDSLTLGLDNAQIQGAIAKNWTYQAGVPESGVASTTIDSLKQASQDYLVPLSDQTINAWTEKVLAGNATAQDFTEYAKQQAHSLFPTMRAALDRGMTVQQYADPYKQLAAQTLNIDPNAIDFTDPKWRRALDQVDPTTKDRTVMSLSDWTKTLKTDPIYGYDKTAQAGQQSAAFVQQIAQTFGALG